MVPRWERLRQNEQLGTALFGGLEPPQHALVDGLAAKAT
jgi:hypothetical protein